MANILIIDDDKSILRLLQFTLQRAGHAVETAADGLSGLTLIEAKKPDLIVVDVMMPKMNGYEFCRQVRANEDLEVVPIIMFSARFQEIDRETAIEAGATDYLSKTTTPNDLLKRISELLPGRQTATENSAFGIFSLRGGAGSTSLTVNLAVALAMTHKAPTALMDLARIGGHTAVMLGLRPTSSVMQALSATKNNLTADAIKPHLIQHASGVQLLASSHGYDHELHLSDRRLEQMVTLLKSIFSYTLLDIPHILEPGFVTSLQLLDKIVIIVSPDMPALQSTAMALQGLARLGISEDKIILIVNHIFPTGALPSDTIQKVVKCPIIAHIPFEPDMIKSVNTGKPLLLSNPRSRGAAAIAQVANILLA